jgi:hypothetical protein
MHSESGRTKRCICSCQDEKYVDIHNTHYGLEASEVVQNIYWLMNRVNEKYVDIHNTHYGLEASEVVQNIYWLMNREFNIICMVCR